MLALLLALLPPLAQAGDDCTWVGFRDVVDVAPPAVIVLGERHGHQPDLARAAKVVKVLSKDAPVTVAVEAVHRKYQPIVDAFQAGDVDAGDLPGLMDWEESWGFSWKPYRKLVTAGAWDDVDVVAAGLDLGPRPEDAEIPVPPRYLDLLRPAMGEHEMPLSMEQRFVQSMAWRDHELARAGVEAWSGEGFLVVVVGRGHVEGGKGVTWQAAAMTDAEVRGVVLKAGKEPPCHRGDVLWR